MNFLPQKKELPLAFIMDFLSNTWLSCKRGALSASGATKGLVVKSRHAMGLNLDVKDPELVPLTDNVLKLEEHLRDLQKKVLAYQQSVSIMSKNKHDLATSIMYFCGKDRNVGGDAMRYREAVNSISAEGINHSAISIFMTEIQTEVLDEIERRLNNIIELKQSVVDREILRTETETLSGHVRYIAFYEFQFFLYSKFRT